jgi:osmoprotectant transport system ATP-binding protein
VRKCVYNRYKYIWKKIYIIEFVPEEAAMITFKNVSKVYADGFKALNKINLEVKEGELLVLIGPSGSGKTTTMKMINRLIDPTEGTISINNVLVKEQNPVTLRRNIGYVIQQIGLFPHMTIAENVALVPKLKKQEPKDYLKRVDELLDMVGLDPEIYRDRYPNELSGGQQQRIGVIRALAAEPSIILMDEPYSALDPISREQLQDDLVSLQEKIKKTIVFVTHDMNEALKIADRICIMKEGEIVQIDTPEKILRYPKNQFVEDFIGEDRLSKQYNLPPLEEALVKGITIKSSKGLAEAIKLSRKHKTEYLVVLGSENKYLGIATSWDIVKFYKEEGYTVKDIIKINEPLNIKETFESAVKKVNDSSLRFLPVVDDDGKYKGILTYGNITEVLADEFLNI